MDRVLLVTHDKHFAHQLKNWLGDYPGEIALEVIDDFEAWLTERESQAKEKDPPSATGDPPATADPPQATDPKTAPKTAEQTATTTAVNTTPTLVVLDPSTPIPKRPQWVTAFRERLATPENPGPVFLLVLSEQPHGSQIALTESGADDVLIKPADRSICLQKIEMLLAHGEPVTPSFLFKVKTKLDIEIGKDCVIDEISEVEIFIKNPVPVRVMTPATLHCDIFGEGPDSRVDVVVIGCTPVDEPTHPFRLHLRFFGLRSKQLSKLRHTVSKLLQTTADQKRAHRGFKKEKTSARLPVIVSEQELIRPLKLAVIDLDPTTAKLFADALESKTSKTTIVTYATPSRLLAELKAHGAPPPVAPIQAETSAPPTTVSTPAPAATPEAEEVALGDLVGEVTSTETAALAALLPGAEGISVLVLGDESAAITKIETAWEDEETALGYTRLNWQERPDLLLQSLVENDRAAFQEMMAFAVATGRTEGDVNMTALDQRVLHAHLTIERVKEAQGEHAAVLRISIRESTANVEAKRSSEDLQFDGIVIEASFIRHDPKAKIHALREAFVQSGLYKSIETVPPFFVVAEESSPIDSHSFLVEGVSHFAWKIADRRHIIDTFLVFAPKEVWQDPTLIPQRSPAHIPAHLSRDAHVVELSEIGLTVEDNIKFRPGAVLRLFSEVLSENPDGIFARCRSSVPSEKGAINEFVFYGSSEEFQKRIRTFVRAEFARKKALEQAS